MNDELTNHKFEVKFFQKDVYITTIEMEFFGNDLKVVMLDMKARVENHLEKIVTDKGLITTFSGIFAFIRTPDSHIIIEYRPSFNYVMLQNMHDIYEYLKSTGLRIKL